MILSHEWSEILLKNGIGDCQFEFSYASLYGIPEMFLFESGGKSAFIIYIVDDASRTFESPYGYGSFYTTSYEEDFMEGFFSEFMLRMKKRGVIAGILRFHPGIQIPRSSLFETRFIRKTAVAVSPWKLPCLENAKCRNMVRRGWKNGLDIVITDSKEDYTAFGRVYRNEMMRRGASEELLFNDSYFTSLSELHFSRLIAAFDKDSVSGGAIMLVSKNGFSYYHLSAVVLGSGPGISNALLHEGISLCAAQSRSPVMLGGGTTSFEDDPLLKFKIDFSDEMLDFCIGTFIIDRKEYSRKIKEHDDKYGSNTLFLRFKYEK